MKRTLRQALVALIATLVGLELLLQVAGAFGGRFFVRSAGIPGSPDAITILCVGDSHTHGMPVPDQESYPSQLQGLLEKQHPSRAFRVVNLGVPGVNSTFVATRLEGQLLQIRPQLLIVSAGLNNRWNDLWADQATARPWDPLRRFLLHVKLFRLLAVATETARYMPTQSGDGRWRHPDHEAVDNALAVKWYKMVEKNAIHPSNDQIERILEHDMTRMIQTARALGVPIIWYVYPSINDPKKVVTSVIESVARRFDVPLVRAADSVSRAAADGHDLSALFVKASGPHPTGILYGYVAEDMLPTVATTLKLERQRP